MSNIVNEKGEESYSKERKSIFKKNIINRAKYARFVFGWQQKLFSVNKVSIEFLKEASKYLNPTEYDEVVIERHINGFCGYPLCGNPPKEQKSKIYISVKKQTVFDTTPLEPYCSHICYGASKFYEKQLSVEPVYVRAYKKWIYPEIVPVGMTVKDYLTKKHKERIKEEVQIEFKKKYINNLLKHLPNSVAAKSSAMRNINIVAKDPIESVRLNDFSNAAYDSIEGYKAQIRDTNNRSSGMNILSSESSMSLRESESTMESFSNQDENNNLQRYADIEMTSNRDFEYSEQFRESDEENDNDDLSEFDEDEDWFVKPNYGKTGKPKLRPFGKIYMLLTNSQTPSSKKLFERLVAQDKGEGSTFVYINEHYATDEIRLMRRSILAKQILDQWQFTIREFQIKTPMQQFFIDWVNTLDLYQVDVCNFNYAEAFYLCLVMIKKFKDLRLKAFEHISIEKLAEVSNRFNFAYEFVEHLPRYI